MNKKKTDISILVKVARLYYESNFSQLQVSQEIGISRPSVSRLLQQARDRGIVKIEIFDPENQYHELEIRLSEKYNLKKVIIVSSVGSDGLNLIKNLSQATAELLDKLVEDNLILGVSWGTTMSEIKNQIISRNVKDMVVVQLNGGVSRAEYDTHASEVTQKIGEAYKAIPYLLPLPAIVDSADVKKAIISDRNISNTLDLAKKANVALFTIGSFTRESILVKSDYFSTKEVEELLKNGAVADICSRIITHNGKICSQELNSRTIGLDLSEIKSKEYSIAVAGGEQKYKAIRAALNGKLFNTLITDENIARHLLNSDK